MPTAWALTTTQLPVATSPTATIPALFADASDRAAFRVLEFLAARVRNRHTRRAYAQAIRNFSIFPIGARARTIGRSRSDSM